MLLWCYSDNIHFTIRKTITFYFPKNQNGFSLMNMERHFLLLSELNDYLAGETESIRLKESGDEVVRHPELID